MAVCSVTHRRITAHISCCRMINFSALRQFPQSIDVALVQQYASAEAPLKAELFNTAQMEVHGGSLASLHRLSVARHPDRLMSRLIDNYGVLLGAHSLLTQAIKDKDPITPAGEWLLDNFHLIEEQIRTAKKNFPRGYSKELPILASASHVSGHSTGMPRVYDIALEVIAHGDGRVDLGNLNCFVSAYQKIVDLKLGELWALPIMLRFALIENLRRISARVAEAIINKRLAAQWADSMIEIAQTDPKSLIVTIADMARSNPPLVPSFVAELARRLQGHSTALALPLTWIAQRLAESNQTIEQLVQSWTQTQASNQLSISNTITSLRFVGSNDWRDFVGSMSRVESILCLDPIGVYVDMDFATRDRYRHKVESVARLAQVPEVDVAQIAVNLARIAAQSNGADAPIRHVGYYLIDEGCKVLELEVQKLSPLQNQFITRVSFQIRQLKATGKRAAFKRNGFAYMAGIAILTGIFTIQFVEQLRLNNLTTWVVAFIAIPAFLSASQLAVALSNWIATLLSRPHILPRMDFSKTIAPNARTLVIVPTLITSLKAIAELCEALEVRFLANRDQNLRFGLLTDFSDAASEALPEDATLLDAMVAGIESLNSKYASLDVNTAQSNFFLFHRPRLWNQGEKVWMGYERKRGKLSALNKLLKTGDSKEFETIVGETDQLDTFKYVITLDTDTQLPRDCARLMVATMAHPLNRPQFDEKTNTVIAGFGILQPRVSSSTQGKTRSYYSQLWSDETGIDPYTRAISDVYQDLCEEGSFVGKGIYEIDAFERSLNNRLPENRILSHDLLEGCYARAGLVSDVQLYDEYPSLYSVDVSRRYRWIRGDWQIAAWLFGHTPNQEKNPLSNLSKWKILDNLRRSLVPIAMLLLFVVGWTLIEQSLLWTLSVLCVMFLTPLVTATIDLLRKSLDVTLAQHLFLSLQSALRQLRQTLFNLVCLPFEATFSLDAIIRTLIRVHITHRNLLEWRSSGQGLSAKATETKPSELQLTWQAMWVSPAVAIMTTMALAWYRPVALLIASPILMLWVFSPVIVWWSGQPISRKTIQMQPEQTVFLRTLARKTWRYFETFVTEQDHWLPPDNFQEHPVAVIAHRTSPTNMGLSLLANLAAYDFGYSSAGALIQRTQDALQTMQHLERYEGHFYNWYDTITLEPLAPRYVSAVDSGNLSGHLLTLAPGLLGLINQPVVSSRTFEGLRDTFENFLAALQAIDTQNLAANEALGASAQPPKLSLDLIEQLNQRINLAIETGLITIAAAMDALLDIKTSALQIASQLGAQLGAQLGEKSSDEASVTWWIQAVADQCTDAINECTALGVTLLSQPIPTLREVTTTAAQARVAQLHELVTTVNAMAVANYALLYDEVRHLLVVGYNVDQHRRDTAHYDLLASEARLASFVAIAQGAVPQEHWFALGRLLTGGGANPVLLSWSGSMFEYLMPMLVMPTYENTLLEKTCVSSVVRQIAYGNANRVPWGISESGYNAVDASLNYQYFAFGVPSLGLKRGLSEELVIAPYASALALMVMPQAACANLQLLAAQGFEGDYGLFEAIDFTPTRIPRGQTNAVVRSFMVHHQAMSFLSFAYVLLDQPMQKRFVANLSVQATALLLQERIPVSKVFHFSGDMLDAKRAATNNPQMPVRIFATPNTPIPEIQLLSNGSYHVMVTNAGAGYSRWKDLSINRWREDVTLDSWGNFFYIRDISSNTFWSATHQPTLKKADSYEAIFSEGRAEFRRRDADCETYTEMVVSPEDHIEMRRMRITNHSSKRQLFELTSYCEVVLAPASSDASHPAFSNLFVQTEILEDLSAVVCTRRPRSADEKMPWLFAMMVVRDTDVVSTSFETDRSQFIGRTRSIESPVAMQQARLSGSSGSVLDPIIAIRHCITLDADQTGMIDWVCGIAESRCAAINLIGKYRDRPLANRVFDLAWTHSWVNLRQINANEADAQLFARIAGSIIYANPSLRAPADVLIRNRRGQSGLWGYTISGDLPIVLVQINDIERIELARQMVQAHAYWRSKGLAVDLVIWNEDKVGYRQVLQEQILGIVTASASAHTADRPGGIFVRVAEQISAEDRVLFQTVARVVLSDAKGSLIDQVLMATKTTQRKENTIQKLATRVATGRAPLIAPPTVIADEKLFTGTPLGGFSSDGREYVINTSASQKTPAPWVNVLANAHFGSVISESGSAYTWGENAHEFRLTPWSNDPVSDPTGEAIYIRDEASGVYWSPTPLPKNSGQPYQTRHGFGYSKFLHDFDGIVSELTIYVDLNAAVKYSVLTLRNHSDRTRQLSVTGYVDWILSDLKNKSAMHVVTQHDALSGAICAFNPYSLEFARRTAFFDTHEATSFTCQRSEFIGRNGSMAHPAAMQRAHLSNKVGAGLDPCAAMRVGFELPSGVDKEIIFRLGTLGALDRQDASAATGHIKSLQGRDTARQSLKAVKDYWDVTLGAVQVKTPNKALDMLCNGWLMYQTIACRVWARSGFYQSGGAFGFRDQLQDTMAIVHSRPELVREHLLRCAAHQFIEGDVQHWWHPPSSQGVRTRCSDDFLWLPQAVVRYVTITGDTSVLAEEVAFLEGRPVNAADDSYYDTPTFSAQKSSVYQHCVKAIEHGLRFGSHGLPLMGSGDWNDGMNLVGIQGKGESIWLGFFLYDTLINFSRLATQQKDDVFAARCNLEAQTLQQNLEEHGWDGHWYLRAYFDNGQALGSASNEECQIDAIAQSWSVLSGAGDIKRAQQAMSEVSNRLVNRQHGVVQVLDPPFDRSELNPGYIKGYVPGVRENGGQYTHAAIWSAMAFAKQQDSAHAWEIFDIINPVRHGASVSSIAAYKVEPYVIAADVYGVAPHVGRGGWTWYTGSAGWMYRLILESLLGLSVTDGNLRFAPCIPSDWDEFSIDYRYRTTHYTISFKQHFRDELSALGQTITVDGVINANDFIALVDDQSFHTVAIARARPSS